MVRGNNVTLDRLTALTIRAALCSTARRRVGALVLRGNRIVSFGCNKLKTHPQSPSKWSIHAEVDAVLGVPLHEMHGATIWVVRLTKTGMLAMSRPCAACKAMLNAVGITAYVWSGADRTMHYEVN